MSTMNSDPMAVAVQEAERPNFLYGQIEVVASFVMFTQDRKKVDWIEGQDNPRDQRTEISFIFNPIEESGLTKLITKSVIANNYNEWATIIWPSLRDNCKIANLREADKKWFKIESIETGRTWKTRDGEERKNTTFKFVQIFDTQEACVADYLNEGGTDKAAAPINDNGHSMTEMAAEIDMSPTAERETALSFLPALVKMSSGNRDMLAQQISGMPMIAKFFTVDSPEVQQLLKAA